ncbi:PHD-finger domain-containing protein [Ceratocystis lukuohia]|uniref:PHD-finger domain-containing protein n=1 Tax=Ceratocystis lukuohia TaxID=2019550 RepID=A0ABR4MJ60_9PEZI
MIQKPPPSPHVRGKPSGTPTGRRRGRPPGSTNAARAARLAAAAAAAAAAASGTVPDVDAVPGAVVSPTSMSLGAAPKRRRYIPGGPGGGGRFVDEEGVTIPAIASAASVAHKAAAAAARAARIEQQRLHRLHYAQQNRHSHQYSHSHSHINYQRRQRSPHSPYSSSNSSQSSHSPCSSRSSHSPRSPHSPYSPSTGVASVATRVARNPRRRRDGIEDSEEFGSAAAVAAAVAQSEGYKPREERGWEEFHPDLELDARFKVFNAAEVDGTAPESPTTAQETIPLPPTTPPKRKVGRPPRDPSAYSGMTATLGRTPIVLPIHNQTPKERLDLKRPSYRRTDRTSLFESKVPDSDCQISEAVARVGFQQTNQYQRPAHRLIKANDGGWESNNNNNIRNGNNNDSDIDEASTGDTDASTGAIPGTSGASVVVDRSFGRVEYDMDEQDDKWLEAINRERQAADVEPVTRELLEITITKIEKEWHALEKRIPKPNPKPPQTQRPRSSSAAAVNGEAGAGPSSGEEPDSKCAICDDGDCENTNAIVFCDGCDLAVHQECYGVPFIPEGQWLCRKCQLIGRGIPTCIFCPNTDGAFKQTNTSKWAHLLCAMWIPEVSLGNHTFMEPIMEVDKVPKTRWRLSCYICEQRMGACIQCSNKNCFQAFHVTCARRARLFLKMKTSQGVLAVLDGAMTLKAFCDRHCPLDYIETSKVAEATRAARHFYRKKMRGRFWADSESTAALITAQYSVAYDSTESSSGSMGPRRLMGPLPSGAPVIPSSVFDAVDTAMARFSLRKRREFVADVCRYWTLKREARRGAALLKRLQLQMETFPSMELTRRNFVSMGPTGRARLQRRIEFVDMLVHDLNHLRSLSRTLVQREAIKLRAAKAEKDFVDTCYFPVARDIAAIIEKAQSLDNNVFSTGLSALQRRIHARFYTTTLTFARDFADVVSAGIASEGNALARPIAYGLEAPPTKQKYSDIHARKTLGKHIINSVQPCFETAVITEAAVLQRPVDELRKELEEVLRAATELRVDELIGQSQGEDSVMPDAPLPGQPVAEDVVMSEAHQDTKETMAKTPLENIAHDAHVLEKPISQTTPPQTTESSLPPSSALGPQDAVDKSVHMLQSTNQNQTPPTPPQSTSNMSFLSDVSAPLPCNVLTDGGPLWYLSDFGVEGLSVVDQYSCDETVHALGEELTDLEDEELKGLDRDIERALGLASGVKIQIPNRPLVKVQATQMGPSMSEAKEQPEEQPEERSERCPPNQNAPEKESLGKDVEMVDVIASTESQPVGPANDPDATPDSVDDDSAPPRNTASGSEDTPEPATSTPPTDSAYLPTSPRCAASVAISLEAPQITVTDASLATSIANGCDSEPASAADPDSQATADPVTTPRHTSPSRTAAHKAPMSPPPLSPYKSATVPSLLPSLKLHPFESTLPLHPAPQSVLSELSDVSSLPDIDGDADLKDGEGEAEAEADPAAQDTAHNQTQPGVQDEADTHVEAQDKEEGTVQENANFDLLASTIAPSDNNLDLLLVTANKDTLPLITRATRANVAAAREAEAQQLELEQRELELERKKRTRSSTRTRK